MPSPVKDSFQSGRASVPTLADPRRSAAYRAALKLAPPGKDFGPRIPRGPRLLLASILLFAAAVLLHVFHEELYLAAVPASSATGGAPPLSRRVAVVQRRAAVTARRNPKPQLESSSGRLESVPSTPALSLAARRALVNLNEIWMDDVEVDLVLRYLGGIRNYLEWGSGGSTVNFARFATRRAVSIEHSPEWCGYTTRRIREKRIRPVEMRCVRNDTAYYSDGHYREFREYVDEIAKVGEPIWDFVLVDGRCRVGAAIRALSYISDSSVVVLHDSERMRQNGAPYRRILDYYDEVENIIGATRRGLSILKRKQALSALQGDDEKVQTILDNVYGMKK